MHIAFILLVFKFETDSDKQKRKTEKRLKRLRKIQNNLEENLMLSVDSDEDFASNFLKVGDTIDYLYLFRHSIIIHF